MERTTATAVLALSLVGLCNAQAAENQWEIGDPVFCAGPAGSIDEVAVKDPSIVFFEETWHLFYTARSEEEYTTGYVSAGNWTGMQKAQRHTLPMIRGEVSHYGCAPQVFYFEPQEKWYLIFQTRDSNYQPMFSTTETIAEPKSWSPPQILLAKDVHTKWIDFWIICDDEKAYLFYSQLGTVMVRSTSFDRFPNGWCDAKEVFWNIHESVHVYKARGLDEYHMFCELNDKEKKERIFTFARAKSLEGPWEKVTVHYARGSQLHFLGKQPRWTDMTSHGEILRVGYDQRMEYDPADCQWLIQGVLKKNYESIPYPKIPWKLGIMSKVKSTGSD